MERLYKHCFELFKRVQVTNMKTFIRLKFVVSYITKDVYMDSI